jgi:benzoylformate decarboxylase
MPEMIGKKAFLDLLHQEGIEIIFGNPGTTELPLMEALGGDTRFRYILGLQEAVVVGMADGYSQASRRLAMVNLHAMPGLGNAMGMLYDAQKAGCPLLVTAGQQDQSFLLSEPILHGDLVEMVRPLVKWSYEVRDLRDLPTAVHRACKVALTPPMGPVFLSVPGDVLMQTADVDLSDKSRIMPRVRGDLDAVRAAANLIAQAQKPVIMAGDAVAQSDALAELVAFAELLGAPVYAEAIGNTASFPMSHPLFAGTVPRMAAAFAKMVAQHDLLISVGADLFTLSLPPRHAPLPDTLKIVHFDLDPWEIGKNFRTDVGFLADPKTTLPELSSAVEAAIDAKTRANHQTRRTQVQETIAKRRAALDERARGQARHSPIRPLALLQAIGKALPGDAIVVEELLSSAEGIRELICSNDARSFYGMRGGGIGWGLAAAIGVKLAQPARPVIALIGDGSAMYTIQALWSAAHYKIPVVFVIFNNKSYRILKQRMAAVRTTPANDFLAMDLTNPVIDFVSLARALGVEARSVTTIDQTLDALNRGLQIEAPLLIDVTIDSTVAASG